MTFNIITFSTHTQALAAGHPLPRQRQRRRRKKPSDGGGQSAPAEGAAAAPEVLEQVSVGGGSVLLPRK